VTTIRAATERDIPVLARTYARAFADDPVIRWLVPDDDEYAAIGERFFAAPARRFLAQEALWCTDDGVAVAGWNLPGRPEIEIDDPDLIEHPEWRIERFMALRAKMIEHAPPDEHWHLNILGTHPDWQRQGLGGALMAHTFAIADAAGLPCYLETETPENVAYYRGRGFEVRSEWELSAPGAPGPHMWGMLRPAG
jgi:ribosomal protein S18 acetylase RimI-like enzyme